MFIWTRVSVAKKHIWLEVKHFQSRRAHCHDCFQTLVNDWSMHDEVKIWKRQTQFWNFSFSMDTIVIRHLKGAAQISKQLMLSKTFEQIYATDSESINIREKDKDNCKIAYREKNVLDGTSKKHSISKKIVRNLVIVEHDMALIPSPSSVQFSCLEDRVDHGTVAIPRALKIVSITTLWSFHLPERPYRSLHCGHSICMENRVDHSTAAFSSA